MVTLTLKTMATSSILLDPIVANNTYREPTGSILPHILLYLFQIVALISPNFSGRRWVFIGILLALFVESQCNLHFITNLSLAQPFCIYWAFLFATFKNLILSSEKGLRHISSGMIAALKRLCVICHEL